MTDKMEINLQTNNDLIISIHKSLMESVQQTNRKIENLRDDIRDVKLSLTKNSDRIMQEEANNWRQHTEKIVKQLGERHEREVANLHKMVMELCIRSPLTPATTGQSTMAASPNETHLGEQPALKSAEIEAVNSKKEAAVTGIQWKVAEPVGFKPPTQTVPQTTAMKAATTTMTSSLSSASINWAAQLPSLPITPTTTVKKEQQSPYAISTVAPIITTAPISTAMSSIITTEATAPTTAVTVPSIFRMTALPCQPIQQQQTINSSVTTIPATPAAATTVMPSPATFSFKGSSAAALDVGGGSFQGAGGSPLQAAGSMFSGAAKSGTNSFANLAAKAAESGGGFLSNNAGAGIEKQQPQFGQSFFGTSFNSSAAKDFKLFQPSSSPHPSLNLSNIRSSKKGLDDSPQADEGSDKEDQGDEFVPNVYYEPAVPLPPEIEVATGEEEEETIFSARCKLYRYDKEAKENKERGLGEIKLLFNPRSSRYRCVMRREQVLKLCANFPIYQDLKLLPREQMPTVFTWACKDFSEDTENGSDETFSARFKDKAIAQEFYEKMTEAIENSLGQ